MRIDDRQLAGNQAAQSGKASAAQVVDHRGDSRQVDSRWGGAADRVEISDLTGGLARALQASSAERAGRVEQLQRSVSEGRYRPDSVATSRAIVAEMRAAGSGQAPSAPAA
jgi:anti-sigma28 factor (negative regulator of flagellin synthesis)